MADALKRFGPTQLGAAAATFYDPPAAGATLRQMIFCHEGASSRTFRVSIGADGAGKRLYFNQPIEPGETKTWEGAIELADADVLQGLASAASEITVTGSVIEH